MAAVPAEAIVFMDNVCRQRMSTKIYLISRLWRLDEGASTRGAQLRHASKTRQELGLPKSALKDPSSCLLPRHGVISPFQFRNKQLIVQWINNADELGSAMRTFEAVAFESRSIYCGSGFPFERQSAGALGTLNEGQPG